MKALWIASLRVVAGLVLIGLAATGKVGLWGYIGVVPLLTGAVGMVPALHHPWHQHLPGRAADRQAVPEPGGRLMQDTAAALQVEGYFDPATWTVSYIVLDKRHPKRCALVDSVLDYDPKSGTHLACPCADRLIARVHELGARRCNGFWRRMCTPTT